jgi:hypothetical protein
MSAASASWQNIFTSRPTSWASSRSGNIKLSVPDQEAIFRRGQPVRLALRFLFVLEIIREGCEMAANSVQSEGECAVGHEHENAIQAPRANSGVSANGNNALKAVSQARNSPEIETALV